MENETMIVPNRKEFVPGVAKRKVKSSRQVIKKKDIYDDHGGTWLYNHRQALGKVGIFVGDLYYMETRFTQIVNLEQIQMEEIMHYDVRFRELKANGFQHVSDPVTALIEDLNLYSRANSEDEIIVATLAQKLDFFKAKLETARDSSNQLVGIKVFLLRKIVDVSISHINDLSTISQLFHKVNVIIDDPLNIDSDTEIMESNLNLSKVAISSMAISICKSLLDLNFRMLQYWSDSIKILNGSELFILPQSFDKFKSLIDSALLEISTFSTVFSSDSYLYREVLSKQLDHIISELHKDFAIRQKFLNDSKLVSNSSRSSSSRIEEGCVVTASNMTSEMRMQMAPLIKFVVGLNSSLLAVLSLFSNFINKFQQKMYEIFVHNLKMKEIAPLMLSDIVDSALSVDFMRTTFHEHIERIIEENNIKERYEVANSILDHLKEVIEKDYLHRGIVIEEVSDKLLKEICDGVISHDWLLEICNEVALEEIKSNILSEVISQEYMHSICQACYDDEAVRGEVGVFLEDTIIRVIDGCLFVKDAYYFIIDTLIRDYSKACLTRMLTQSLTGLAIDDDIDEDEHSINSRSKLESLDLSAVLADSHVEASKHLTPRLISDIVNFARDTLTLRTVEAQSLSPRLIDSIVDRARDGLTAKKVEAQLLADNLINNAKDKIIAAENSITASKDQFIASSNELKNDIIHSAEASKERLIASSNELKNDIIHSAEASKERLIASTNELKNDIIHSAEASKEHLAAAGNEVFNTIANLPQSLSKLSFGKEEVGNELGRDDSNKKSSKSLSFEDFDLNKDGVLSVDEFNEMLRVQSSVQLVRVENSHSSSALTQNKRSSRSSLQSSVSGDLDEHLRKEGYHIENWKDNLSESSSGLNFPSSSVVSKSLLSRSNTSASIPEEEEFILKQSVHNSTSGEVLKVLQSLIGIVKGSLENCFDAYLNLPSIEFLVIDSSVNRIRNISFTSRNISNLNKVGFNFAIMKITNRLKAWVSRYLDRKYGASRRVSAAVISPAPSLGALSRSSGSRNLLANIPLLEEEDEEEKDISSGKVIESAPLASKGDTEKGSRGMNSEIGGLIKQPANDSVDAGASIAVAVSKGDNAIVGDGHTKLREEFSIKLAVKSTMPRRITAIKTNSSSSSNNNDNNNIDNNSHNNYNNNNNNIENNSNNNSNDNLSNRITGTADANNNDSVEDSKVSSSGKSNAISALDNKLSLKRRDNIAVAGALASGGFKKVVNFPLNSQLILCLNLSSNLLTHLWGIEVCSNLKILDISDNLIESLRALRACRNLIRLRAPGNKLVAVDIYDDAEESKIVAIGASNDSKISGGGDSGRRRFHEDDNSLGSLYGTAASDSDLSQAFNQTNIIRLEYLDISENDILTLDGLTACGRESLKHLEAKNCGLDLSKLSTIRDFKVLEVILLNNNKLSGLMSLIELLSSNLSEKIKELSFIGNPVVNERMKIISSSTTNASGVGGVDENNLNDGNIPGNFSPSSSSSPPPHLINKKSMHYMLSMIDNFQFLESLDHNKVTIDMRNRFKLLKFQLDTEVSLRNIDSKYIEEMTNAALIWANVKKKHEETEKILMNAVVGRLSSLSEERENFAEYSKSRLKVAIDKRDFEDHLKSIVKQKDSAWSANTTTSNALATNTETATYGNDGTASSSMKKVESLNSVKLVSQIVDEFTDLRNVEK